MARLTEAEWQSVKIDYEVNKLTYTKLSELYGVDKSNISRRAIKDGWNQNATQELIAQSVENTKENLKIRNITQQLNATERLAIQDAVQHELEMQGIYQHFDKKLMHKALHHIDLIQDDDEQAVNKLVQLSTVRKNVSPKSIEQTPAAQNNTQINVNNSEDSAFLDYTKIELISAVR